MDKNVLSELRVAIKKGAKNLNQSKRSRCIRIYLTPDEERQILDSCQGVAASIYCRAKVLGQFVPRSRRQIPEINRQYYAEISRVSVNLNQISKAINHVLIQSQELPINEAILSQLKATQETLKLHRLEVIKLISDYSTETEGENDADWQGNL